MNKTITVIAVICLLLLSSCVHQQPQAQQYLEGKTLGFWGGLWHGIISPIMFIAHLFDNTIAVWAPKNNGGWYTFGFLLGAGAFVSSSSAGVRHSRR